MPDRDWTDEDLQVGRECVVCVVNRDNQFVCEGQYVRAVIVCDVDREECVCCRQRGVCVM